MLRGYGTTSKTDSTLLVLVVIAMVTVVLVMIGLSAHDLLQSMSRHATTIGGSY